MTSRESHSPTTNQSEKSIRKWLRGNIKVGAVVAIRSIQDGMLQYQRGAVLSIRPKNFNVGRQRGDGTFSESGETFDYSGRSWREPSGPTRLMVPTPVVLRLCDACNSGTRFAPQDLDKPR